MRITIFAFLLFVLPAQSQIDSIVESAMTDFPENTELSIAVIENGLVEYIGIQKTSNGFTYLDNHQAVFEIGSLSKVFTSTLFANALLEGKVKEDDDVAKTLKTKFNNKEKMSLLSLSNHTSGLFRLPSNIFNSMSSNPQDPYALYGETELIEYLKELLEMESETGSKYSYSNLGAGLLGYVMTKVYQKSYSDLIEEKIALPYQLVNTTADPSKVKNRLVPGMDGEGKTSSNWNFNVLVGAGGILSTSEDISNFVLAQFEEGNEELQLTQKVSFEVSEQMAMGLGWHILYTFKEPVYFHNGQTGGYTSSTLFNPKTKNGVVILSNVSGLNPDAGKIDGLTFLLLKGME